MIKIYEEVNDGLDYKKIKNDDDSYLDVIHPRVLIDVTSPNLEMLEKISNATSLPLQSLQLSLDTEEMAHVDFDETSNLIVIDIPSSDDDDRFFTMPFFICFNDQYMVTICKKRNDILKNVIKNAKKFEPHKHTRTTLFILYRIAQEYIKSLREIDKRTRDVETKLHDSTKNKELIELMDLNKMLVYFSTSLNSNKAVTLKLLRSTLFRQYEANQDLMEDLVVENDQAIEMCNIYRDILAGTMDAFASIISNNLNVVMKTLAIITIVLSIPTMVSGFYGMNVSNVPLGENNYAFWIIIGISGILAFIAGICFFFYGRKSRTKAFKKRSKK